MPSDILADLSPNALIAVTGDDATAFLHGQFTNDVEALHAGDAQWNGWCTPKGRLLATFLLLRRAEGYLLMLPAEIAEGFSKRLRMYVLRSKVAIDDATGRYSRVALAGANVAAFAAKHWGQAPAPMRSAEKNGSICIGLAADRYVGLVPAENSKRFHAVIPKDWIRTGSEPWDLIMIRAGIPIILAATQEAFVPQMANFDLVGGVSFKKGCYPGQEIVARTQYRGGLKRRMAVVALPAGERPMPGDSVYSGAFGDQAAGTIVNSARAPDSGYEALVVAQIESLETRDLRWKAPDGPRLEILSHPAIETAGAS